MAPRKKKNLVIDDFGYVFSLVENFRAATIRGINTNLLMCYWNIGAYISAKIHDAGWGDKVVKELADYLKLHNPKLRGFGKRNLYNMVKFYEVYHSNEFQKIAASFEKSEFVQLSTAQITANPIVQFENAQLHVVPSILTVTTFTNHVEILNRCGTYEERLFYILYSAQQRLKTEELRRCIVTQTFETLLSKEKKLSPAMLKAYPTAEFMLKDKAFLDFLKLPQKHNEHHLHAGLLEHMKEFILELGKDFIFMENEYPVQVGGSIKRIDMLFFHRALQCLVAIELKVVDFEPEFVSKMDMYLEALDRDVKRENENPSIGIILCPSVDKSMVEYTLSRSLSPTMIAEYKQKLIPVDVMKKSLQEYCEFLGKIK